MAAIPRGSCFRSNSPGLAADKFTVLLDDKALVPNDVILPLVNTGSASDDVLSVLDATSAALTTSAMQSMMVRLKVDGAPPEVVANEFIAKVGTGP